MSAASKKSKSRRGGSGEPPRKKARTQDEEEKKQAPSAMETLLHANVEPRSRRAPGKLVLAARFDFKRDFNVGKLRFYKQGDGMSTKIVDMWAIPPQMGGIKGKRLWLQFKGPGFIHQEYGVTNKFGKVYFQFPVMHQTEVDNLRDLDAFLLQRSLDQNYWPETYKEGSPVPTPEMMKAMKLYRPILGPSKPKQDGNGHWPPKIKVSVKGSTIVHDHQKKEININNTGGQRYARVIILLKQHYFQSQILGTTKELIKVEMAAPVQKQPEEEEDETMGNPDVDFLEDEMGLEEAYGL